MNSNIRYYKSSIRDGKITINTLKNFTCAIVAITIFLSIDPFFVWSSFAGGIGTSLFKALQIFSVLLLFGHLMTRKIPTPIFVCGLAMLGIFFFYSFFTGIKSGTTHPLLIGNLLVYFFYALNAMTDKEIILKSFKMLRTIFVVFLGYTLIVYVLILLRVPIPYEVLQSGEAGRVEAGFQTYRNYLGCILINQRGNLMYRFTSVFTEPGVVGTFCAFFLAASGCNLKKHHKQDWIFLISGLLSLSVAFYAMLILIFMMKAWRKGGYKLVAGLAIIVIVYAIFININVSNPMIAALQERLTITETGLAGDNRIDEIAEASYREFLASDLKTVLLGYGYPDSTNTAAAWQATASYKESVYCLGILGYGLMLAWFVLVPLVCCRSENKAGNRLMYSYMVIFVLSQYQRPYMKAFFLVYFLLAGCLYAQEYADDSDESLLSKNENSLLTDRY